MYYGRPGGAAGWTASTRRSCRPAGCASISAPMSATGPVAGRAWAPGWSPSSRSRDFARFLRWLFRARSPGDRSRAGGGGTAGHGDAAGQPAHAHGHHRLAALHRRGDAGAVVRLGALDSGVDVPATTLDALIASHGAARFRQDRRRGHGARGAGRAVAAAAGAVVRVRARGAGQRAGQPGSPRAAADRFNVSLGESLALEFPAWIDAPTLRLWLRIGSRPTPRATSTPVPSRGATLPAGTTGPDGRLAVLNAPQPMSFRRRTAKLRLLAPLGAAAPMRPSCIAVQQRRWISRSASAERQSLGSTSSSPRSPASRTGAWLPRSGRGRGRSPCRRAGGGGSAGEPRLVAVVLGPHSMRPS